MATIRELIIDCVEEVLHINRDSIPTNVRDLCLNIVNTKGREIFDSWPWDNSKVLELTVTSDANGIITFPISVDVVRVLRSTGELGSQIYNETELVNYTGAVGTRRYQSLPALAGCRRIKVPDVNTEHKALCLAKFVSYSSLASGATGYSADRDYTLVSFIIDVAENALRGFLKDALRQYMGEAVTNEGSSAMGVALNREKSLGNVEYKVAPRYPMFSESGDL